MLKRLYISCMCAYCNGGVRKWHTTHMHSYISVRIKMALFMKHQAHCNHAPKVRRVIIINGRNDS